MRDYYKGEYNGKDTILLIKPQDDPGMQLWTVPQTGRYKVVCFGAQGGNSIYQEMHYLFGGKGAKVGGIIKLFKNDVMKILCGQTGETSTNGYGGGGGTFFVLYHTAKYNTLYTIYQYTNIFTHRR